MLSKRRIAVAIAGLFLGTQAVMAALEEKSASENAAAPVEQVQPVQVEQVDVQPLVEAAQPLPETVQAEQAAPAVVLVVPVAPVAAAPRSNVFPSAAEEHAQLLPAMVAYLDQRAASMTLAGASGNVFPSASEEHAPQLPAMTAYLDQRNGTAINVAMQSNLATDSVQ